jgi:hypothetical protein
MTDTIHLPVDLARDLTFENVGSCLDGWTVVHKETTGRGRWDIHKRIVIRSAEGQHYAAKYSEGATEYQNGSFEGRETYEFTPVVARTRMVEVTDYLTPEEADRG